MVFNVQGGNAIAYVHQPSMLLQVYHNQSLEDRFLITPAYAGSQASRRHLLSRPYADSTAHDHIPGYIQQQHGLPTHRLILADEAPVVAAPAAGSVEDIVSSAGNVQYGVHSAAAQSHSSINGTGVWFGYNVTFKPHITLHEQYNLSHDDSNQTVVPGLWYGYDVQYRLQQSGSKLRKFVPRYIAGRNQLLGGLYFQQVHVTGSAIASAFVHIYDMATTFWSFQLKTRCFPWT